MSKSKNYLGLGIVLAIFAALVSLMFIAFSYADVNELNANENAEVEQIEAVVGGEELNEAAEEEVTNDAWIISFSNAGTAEIGTYHFENRSISPPSTITSITLPASCTSYNLSIETDNILKVTLNGVSAAPLRVGVVCESSDVVFEGWGNLPFGPLMNNYTISPVINKKEVTYNSAVITGQVYDRTSNRTGLANACVCLASENTGKVYLTTTTNSDGEYTLNNVKPEWINDDDNNPFTIYSSCPGYSINNCWFNAQNPDRVDDNIAYFEGNNMGIRPADVNVSGADHHQVFDVEMVIHKPTGDDKQVYKLPFFGLMNDDLNKGAELVADENGLITGTAITEIMGYEIPTDITCQAICDDGFKFSYLDLNGTKYNVGETIVLDGVSEYTAVVNYEAVAQPENVTAQTGDAIPYAVIAGLGLLAVFAFVVARKQYNK